MDETEQLEAQAPPVARIAGLPADLRALAERGVRAWRDGQCDEAREALEQLLAAATAADSRDGAFHALHLLANVAFTEHNFAKARELHTHVLSLCKEIDFHGGMGSSFFNLAMVAEAEGDVESAEQLCGEALQSFQAGGYEDQLPLVRAAIERFASTQHK